MADSLMRAEIGEQPDAVARTLAQAGPDADALAQAVRRAGLTTVVLVARGSSDHAALYARYLLEARCGLVSALAAPSLYTTYRAPVDLSRALVVGISQSGEVPEIVDSLRYARERGALTAALTNHAGSPLADACDHALVTQAGSEQSVAATKTFTTQLALIARLAAALGASDVAGCLDRLPEAMADALESAEAADAAAASLAGHDACVCVARGFSYAIALEAALKLKETAGLWAEGFSSADLRHGPSSAARGLPAIVLHAGGPLERDVAEIEHVLGERGSRVISIGPGRDLPVRGDLAEEVMPLVLVVPAQLLAERTARRRGRDPDNPPGLVKVTRTV